MRVTHGGCLHRTFLCSGAGTVRKCCLRGPDYIQLATGDLPSVATRATYSTSSINMQTFKDWQRSTHQGHLCSEFVCLFSTGILTTASGWWQLNLAKETKTAGACPRWLRPNMLSSPGR